MTDIAGAMGKVTLPTDTGIESARKTGTDDLQAHQMAHQTVLFSGHSGALGCTTGNLDSGQAKSEQVSINTGVCATVPTGALKAGDGIRTHDVQLGKLAFYR